MLKNTEGEYGKYILQDLQDPNMGSISFQEMYKKFSKRVLWIDSKVVPGSFQMNVAWYHSIPEINPPFEEHAHPYDELIGFFGGDPSDPYNLNGELEVAINGEWHLLDRTSLIFLPGGLKHMPLVIKRIDKPILHFSVVMSPEYSGDTAYK